MHEMKYIFFVALLTVVKTQEIFELNRIIIDTFFKDKYFLCVVHNNQLNNIGVINGMATRNIKTYNFNELEETKKMTECGHSVLIASDEEILDSMLIKKNKILRFLVHSTILVLFRGSTEINMKKYQNFAIEKNLEVIIARGLALSSLFPPRAVKNQLKIYSAIRNELLINCSLSVDCFSNFTYVRTKWTPIFMLKKLKREFRIAFSIYPPLIIRKGDRLSGVDIEVAKLLTEGWPTHFKLLKRDSKRKVSYIHKHPIYYVNSTEADMVIGVSKFSGEKSTTYPYTSQCNTFLVHRGQLYPDATFTFQFFQAHLWLIFIVILIFMAFLIKCSSRIYGHQYSLIYSFVLVIGYVTSYGVPPFPPQRQTFMRFVSLWWCFISLLITTYFSAGLTSALRLPRIHDVLSTWEEMIGHGVKWLDKTDEAVKRMNDSEGSLQRLVDSFELANNYKTISEKLKTKKYAIRVERFKRNILNVIGELDNYDRDYLKILHNCFSVHPIQFEINYNSAVANFLNSKILHIVEAGFVDFVFRDLSDDPERAFMQYFFKRKNNRNRLFTLQKLIGCFLLLGLGCFLGLVGLFYEFFVYKMKEKKKKRKMRGLPMQRRIKK